MTYLDYLEQKVLLERLVIGLEEPVLIKGLGELSAKIDSGNGGYNVIHGTDFHQQGSELMFTTHDSFGHDKKIQATVIDTIEVNMGGGNIESRPVIELDIKFAGEDYKKIPFSVSDRSTNSNPILISKGFVENELEALIDVGAMNISHEGIDVVYGESVLLDEGVFKTLGDIKRGVQNVGNAYNRVMTGVKNFGDWMGGNAKMSDWMPTTQGVKDIAKTATMGLLGATGIRSMWKLGARIKNGISLNSEDKKQISAKLNASNDIVKYFTDKKATDGTFLENGENNLKEVTPIAIFNFAFQKGEVGSKNYVKGMEKQAKKFKSAISKAKEGVQSRKRDMDDKALADKAEGVDNAQKSEQENKHSQQIFNKWFSNNQKQVNSSFEIYSDCESLLTETLIILDEASSPQPAPNNNQNQQQSNNN